MPDWAQAKEKVVTLLKESRQDLLKLLDNMIQYTFLTANPAVQKIQDRLNHHTGSARNRKAPASAPPLPRGFLRCR